MPNRKGIILVGFSGHGYAAADCIVSAKRRLVGYCDVEEKNRNPFNIKYLGSENSEVAMASFKANECFIAIGDNHIREKIFNTLSKVDSINFTNIVHESAVISPMVTMEKAIMIGPNATINILTEINNGVICNTACIIEHECKIDAFAHIAPGAVLAGNVTIGKRSFIGANAVVKQGVTIGSDVTVGAGSVVIRDIPDGQTVVGNPARLLYK